jgi:hypothetical protein
MHGIINRVQRLGDYSKETIDMFVYFYADNVGLEDTVNECGLQLPDHPLTFRIDEYTLIAIVAHRRVCNTTHGEHCYLYRITVYPRTHSLI